MRSPNVKLIAPRRQAHTLRRVRLLDALHNNVHRKVLFVCAPAGYGKTTLLVDFTEDVDAIVYWYRISAEDNNLAAFYENVLQAFQLRHPDFGHDLGLGVKERTPEPEELAYRLINALGDTLDDFSLFVLDDYHLVSTDPEIVDFVETFISYMPDQLRLLIGSRNVYGIPTALLYVQEQLTIISEEDLKFRQDEIVELCWQYYHIQLTDEQACKISEQAEGWIVAILLALRSENLSMEIPKIFGAREHVYSYLAEEVIHTLPPALIDFLYATSLVDEFNVPLANAILQIENAREIIKQLDELNLFLSSSSESGPEVSYRYHQLFAEFLQGNLHQADPDRLHTLHHRIAEWYQQEEQHIQAISHYFKANEPEHAVSLIDKISRQMYLTGQIRLLEQWYAALSDSHELLSKAPELLLNLAKAVENRGDHDRARRLLEMAKSPLLEREDHSSYVNLLVTLGIAYVHQRMFHEAYELGLKAQAEVDEHGLDRFYWVQAERLKGLCSSNLGELEVAFESLTRAADELRQMLEPDFRQRQAHELGATLSDRALAALALGNIFEAQSSYREALDLARRMQSNHTLLTLVYNNYGYLEYLLGNYQDAWKYYLQGLEVAEINNDEWFTCNLLNGQGDILKDIGEWDRAESVYKKARQSAEKFGKLASVASALSGLIEIEVHRGNFNQAMYYLREMARVQKRKIEEPNYQLRFARIYQAMGQLGLARQTFEPLLTSGMNSPDAPVSQDRVILHFGYAGLLSKSDQHDRAVDHLGRALEFAARLGYDQFLVTQIRNMLPIYQPLLEAMGSPQAMSLLARASKPFPNLEDLVADRQEELEDAEAQVVLNVSALDHGEVRLNGSILPHKAWSSVGARALFYFLLDRKRVTKDEIALEFWPDFSQAKINSNFHATLWRVRNALGSKTIIEFENGRYHFSPDAQIYFDVDELEDLFKVIDRTDNPVERRTAMRRVVELYQTDFIEDIDMPWADERRFELQGRFRTIVAELADDHFEKQNFEAALELYQRAADLDPYQEAYHLRVMQCLAAMGDKSSARAYYQRYAQDLQQEMGMAPDESLRRFADDLG